MIGFMGLIGKEAAKKLAGISQDLFSSYISKPQEQTASDWLMGEFEKKLPDIGGVPVKDIVDGITKGIDGFNNNMQAIKEAKARGITKEDWLKDELKAIAKKRGIEDAGAYIRDIEEALASGNAAVMQVKDGTRTAIKLKEDIFDASENNEAFANGKKQPMNSLFFNIQARKTAEQAALSGIAAASIGDGIELANEVAPPKEGEENPAGEEMLAADTGSVLDKGLKTVAAGALKIAADNKIVSFLTKKTPLSIISSIACWGVEAVKTGWNVFTGKNTVHEGVEHMGQVSCATVAELAVNGTSKAAFAAVPVVGQVVGSTVSITIANQTSKTLSEKLYQGFKKIQPLAETVATGIVKTVKAVADTVKNIGNKVLNFLFG